MSGNGTGTKRPEILSPAGNPEKLAAALRFGADACYLSGKVFGMRSAADNFTGDELSEAVSYAHALGKKIYVTVNVLPHGEEYPALTEHLGFLGEIGADGIIAADLGVMALAREVCPGVALHVSTQTSVTSARAAEQYLRLGARRIVLARELTLREIREIRKETSKELELEAFVHGSMCVSWSGRCLLSNHFTGRDANHGRCAQPCRWNYRLYELEEEKRPGKDERIGIVENDLGTFFMSSRDMCMIEHIPELAEAGIDSFKIEGRMKSAYYAAATANAYRMALDAWENGEPYDPKWRDELDGVSHRRYSTGFYFDNPGENAQTVTEPGYMRERIYAGTVERAADGRIYIIQRNRIAEGDEIDLLTPGRTGIPFRAEDMRDADGEPIAACPHPLMKYSILLPDGMTALPGDMIRK
ncbi:MAG: U32 family peptidase [Clostridia bacterium]|nr:U32 family peptidase [Clostridia bacterium]